ncbi:MAG TPA: CAP domain-containing protein, partial [Acidimicrobiales bacterium]|nr:CAP domain-containing protein [Acidimicrobiales bacterium]
AQAHSDDMAANDYFSHDSLDGRSFADRMRAAGYPSPGGENIAQGQQGPQAVHDAWMNSSGHRANILNCGFTTIGVGLHAGTWTWTQDFGY